MTFSPRRELGRTGFVATRLGIGDLADRQLPLATCVDTLRRALDQGLNLVDTAPGYEDGYSEEIVGAALCGRRDGVFVIDKIDHLDRPVAPQIEASLRRLQLEQVDLFAFHACSRLEDLQQLLAPGGGFDQLRAAAAAGQLRFRGLSSHHPDVLRVAIESGACDVVMFPIGPFVDRRYETEVLPLARARGVGTVCFKTFGAGKLLGDTIGYQQPLAARPRGKTSSGGGATTPTLPTLTVQQCVHYTLTIDPDVALLGLSFPNEQDAAWAAARTFAPLSPGQLAAIRAEAAAAIAGKGDVWWNPPAS
ncbi:MAG: aldo/keto reductase [Planctomycetes bacterium]|nr:aldo/keto reductase [Planctomycetota bacterium]MCB9885972.1 aldo/keto reductase [Planctomycetota bacterium]